MSQQSAHLLALVSIIGSSASSSWAVPSFYPLSMSPSAVSADGLVVVGSSGPPQGAQQAFRWTAEEGMVGLGVLSPGVPLASYVPVGVSGDGSTVVGSGWKWTAATGMAGLSSLPGSTHAYVYGISSDGSVVLGGASVLNSTGIALRVPCRWTRIGIQAIPGVPQGLSAHAQAASADGAVIVGSMYTPGARQQPPEQSEAYRYADNTGMVGLGDIPGGDFYSEAQAVSADGQVIVGISMTDNYTEPFRWTAEGSMVSLGRLPHNTFMAQQIAVNADGSVIVGWAITNTTHTYPPEPGVTLLSGFIWDQEHGMRDFKQELVDDFGFDLSGWGFLAPTGISADGRTIVGTGHGPEGQSGWVLVIPEPETLALGLVMMIVASRRRPLAGR